MKSMTLHRNMNFYELTSNLDIAVCCDSLWRIFPACRKAEKIVIQLDTQPHRGWAQLTTGRLLPPCTPDSVTLPDGRTYSVEVIEDTQHYVSRRLRKRNAREGDVIYFRVIRKA